MVDTGDLKSPGSNAVPVRVRSPAPLDPAPLRRRPPERPQYRGVEQLAARRAHNPEVGGSSPSSATKKERHDLVVSFLFGCVTVLPCKTGRASAAFDRTCKGNPQRFPLHTSPSLRGQVVWRRLYIISQRDISFSNRQRLSEQQKKGCPYGQPFGPSVEIRTRGLLNPIQARYQTSPHPDIQFCSNSLLRIPQFSPFCKPYF